MRSIVFAAVLTAVAVPAVAAPSYNYAEIGYVNLDLDGGNADGFGAAGSYAIDDHFHVVGGIQRISDGGLSVTALTIAGGYRFAMSDTTDLVARAGLARARVGVSGFGSASENGWQVQGGVRSMLNPTLELNGFLTHSDVGGSDTTLGAGVVKTFNERVGVFGGIETNDDGDFLTTIGVRFGF